MDARTQQIQQAFDAIVAEMKRTGTYDIQRPDDGAFENMGAFGMNTMAFSQWLRWVFVPTVEQRLAEDGPWPTSSMVGAQAIREFDGEYELEELVSKLSEFDRLF